MEKKNFKSYEYNKEYIRRYQQKTAEIKLYLKPEEKEQIKELAQAEGKSVNKYILDIILGEGENENV